MFTCKLCNQEFEKIQQLTTHIQFHHKEYNSKSYYDEFLKKPGEGVCPICGREPRFASIIRGYQKYCSDKCAWQDPEVKKKRSDTNSKKTEEDKKQWIIRNIESHRCANGKCISDEELAKRRELSEEGFRSYLTKCDCTFLEYIPEPKKLVRFVCNQTNV